MLNGRYGIYVYFLLDSSWVKVTDVLELEMVILPETLNLYADENSFLSLALYF